MSKRNSDSDRICSSAEWLARMRCFPFYAGLSLLFAGHSPSVEGKILVVPGSRPVGLEREVRPAAASKVSGSPAMLRRQADFRLPWQKGSSPLAELLSGSDNCPGNAVPQGAYTSAAPFLDSGNTAGANNTVGRFDYYYATGGPDLIYTFVLTSRELSPKIEITTQYNEPAIYIINSTTGFSPCPAGTGNSIFGVLAGWWGGDQTQVISLAQSSLNQLRLNERYHLFIDGMTGGGPYTLRIEGVGIGAHETSEAPLDMTGDGRSDFVVARSNGGQLTWYTRSGDNTFPSPVTWGVEGDKLVPADYDGDGKDDIAIWRPGPQGRFYIISSQTGSMHIEDLGQTGDDPTVVADYDGDGRDDLAVYRDGAGPGDQSYWYYRPLGSAVFKTVAWGQHGDRPAPGDYNGQGMADFVVQRAEGANGRFYFRFGNGTLGSFIFGLANDKLVPGDYDDDGKTDVAVVRVAQDGSYLWELDASGTAGITGVRYVWGVAATDILTPGDYDGDGRTELSVWRPGSPGVFYQLVHDAGWISTRSWGEAGDIPAASFNSH